MHKKPFVISVFLIFILLISSALRGNEAVDSLKNLYYTTLDSASVERQINLLKQISAAYKYNKPDSAVVYFEKGIQLAHATENLEEEIFFTLKKGGAYYILGSYDFALEEFFSGLALAEKVGNISHIATAKNNIGLIYNMQRKEWEAINFHREAVNLVVSVPDTLLWARFLFNIGVCYDQLGQELPPEKNDSSRIYFDSAMIYTDSAIKVFGWINDTSEMARTRILKGWIYVNQQQNEMALQTFTKVLKNPFITNQWDLGYAYLGLAMVYHNLRNYRESNRIALISLEIAQQLNTFWDLQQVNKLLSENYAAMGDFQKAYIYHKAYKTFSDSLYNETRDQRITFLELQHKQDENLRLAQENELKEQRIKNKNFQLIGYGAAVVFLILIIISLWRRNRIKNKLNRQLQEKNNEIASTNQKLTQLNNTKDTLLHVMAHDLRSPVSVVVSFSDLMLEEFDQFTPEELRNMIEKVNQASIGGLHLMENLLTWAKAHSGKMNFKPRRLQLKKEVNSIIETQVQQAISKKISLENLIDPHINVTADPDMLAVVIRNLLTNAIKFSNPGGHVLILARQEDSRIAVSVKDTGIGMESGKVADLFGSGQMESTMGTAQEKGSGIGLQLCQEFVEKMGGKIAVESEPGKGSTFTFTLLKG